MESSPPQPPTPKRSTAKIIGIVVAVIVIVFAVAVIIPPLLLGATTSSPTSSSSTPQSHTVISSGTVESLNAGYYYYINFTVPTSAYSISITGSYSSNNNVEVGILSSTQFGAFTQNPSTITSANWYSGDNQGATINFSPTSGHTYSIVIYDGNIITSDTVTIVNAFTLTYTT